MTPLAWSLGPTEMIVIGVVAVLLFGKRLPEVGRDLGRGLRHFKDSLGGAGREISEVKDATREVTDAVRDIDSGPEPDYSYEDETYDEPAETGDEHDEMAEAGAPDEEAGQAVPNDAGDRQTARTDEVAPSEQPVETEGTEEKTA